MNLTRHFPYTPPGLLLAAGLVLMWNFGATINAGAQEGHEDHDHVAAVKNDKEEAVHARHTGDEAAEHEAAEHEGEEHEGEEHEGEEHEGGDVHEGKGQENGDDHSGHAHAEASGEAGLRLTSEQTGRFGIVVVTAGSGSLRNEVSLPGEIVFNEDRVVHVVPRVDGVAREVCKSIGDPVVAGELLAVLYSRELADAKADYLAARARAGLSANKFERQKALRAKQASSEEDFLEAELELAEAEIELRSAQQKLYALDLSDQTVATLNEALDETITRYEIRSPIDGVITEKHVARGESLEASSDIFTVVDTGVVWANLTVYTKNLAVVSRGVDVLLRVDHSGMQARGRISMVTPFVEESTRSATARVVLDNADGRWVPGIFVTGLVSVGEENLPVVVPRYAVQNIEGRDVIFVEHEGGFEMTPVTPGRADRTNIEIVSGIEPGTRYVAEGAYQLKATVVTSNLGSHAGHGH